MLKWTGGKPAGCISIRKTHCQLVFTKSTKLKSNCYSFSKYPSRASAIAQAEEDQRTISDKHGLTRNKYRVVDDCLEVQLQGDLVMKCEIKHLPLVQSRIWTGNKAKDKYTYYVTSRESKKRKQKHALFHKLAFPKYREVDHINRDGLDNREYNVREGSRRVNANNKRMQKNNKSGVKGVYKENGKKARWVAQWCGKDSKRHKKGFGIFTHGEEKAFTLACEYRAARYAETLEHIENDYHRITRPDGSVVMAPLNPPNIVIQV